MTLSCAAFDGGDHAEAQRIATALCVLLYRSGRSRALLVEVGLREQVGWLDTVGSLLPAEASAQTPLVFVSVEQGQATWLPTLDGWDRRLERRQPLPPEAEEKLSRMRADDTWRSRGARVPFAQWWDSHVLRDMNDQSFTRGDVVRAVASTYGEAPIDPFLEDVYQRLSRPSSFGWAMPFEHRPQVPTSSPVLASVRQLAFEVEGSLAQADLS